MEILQSFVAFSEYMNFNQKGVTESASTIYLNRNKTRVVSLTLYWILHILEIVLRLMAHPVESQRILVSFWAHRPRWSRATFYMLNLSLPESNHVWQQNWNGKTLLSSDTTKVRVSFTNSTLNETIWVTVCELVWPRPPFGKAGGPVVNCNCNR